MKKQPQRIDISAFQDSQNLPDMHLFVTIKSFDLQQVRSRYLESKTNAENRAGSVKRRKVGEGGIAYIKISGGKIIETEILKKMKEPRGIAWSQDLFSIAAEDKVFLFQGRQLKTLTDPWFSYIHTIDFSPDQESVVVSSSGFDSIIEYSLGTHEKTNEWFAWENGFDTGIAEDGKSKIILTRDKKRAAALEKAGKKVKLIEDPKKDVLPTAQRAAFINSVLYDNHNAEYWLATFFHEGAVYSIHKETGKAEKIMDGLKNPHGGRRFHNGYLATSTGAGELHLKNSEGTKIFDFAKLPGKAKELGKTEWVQNAAFLGNMIIAIDSNRTSLMVVNTSKNTKTSLPYNPDWAIQDLILIPEEKVEWVKDLIRSIDV